MEDIEAGGRKPIPADYPPDFQVSTFYDPVVGKVDNYKVENTVEKIFVAVDLNYLINR